MQPSGAPLPRPILPTLGTAHMAATVGRVHARHGDPRAGGAWRTTTAPASEGPFRLVAATRMAERPLHGTRRGSATGAAKLLHVAGQGRVKDWICCAGERLARPPSNAAGLNCKPDAG